MDIDPELQVIDNLLDDEQIYNTVKSDLSLRYPKTEATGRPSTPVEVIWRMIILMRLYAWSFAQTIKFVTDSISLRQFCRVYFHSVPTKSTLIRWAVHEVTAERSEHNCITPSTIEMLHHRVVSLAIEQGVTKGRKLRIDTTVVETNIHYPTESGLILDGLAKCTNSGKHQSLCAFDVRCVSCHLRVGSDRFEGFGNTLQVSHAVIDDCDSRFTHPCSFPRMPSRRYRICAGLHSASSGTPSACRSRPCGRNRLGST